MTDDIHIIVATSGRSMTDKLAAYAADGWQLAGPVQVAVAVDGGMVEERYVATLLNSSSPARPRGEVAAVSDSTLSGPGAAPPVRRGGRAVESPPGRDPLDQDPMLDDTARESIWDRR
ncbi:MAG: hypothetical protein K1X95_03505 [Acidimicrobiia bacterium]|nr:hypothetical protein [Acidimicrobiia bacterium]